MAFLRPRRNSEMRLALALPLAGFACGLGDLDLDWSCGPSQTCGETSTLAFVHIDRDPVLGGPPSAVPPLAVGSSTDLGVLGVTTDGQPEYIMQAEIAPEGRFEVSVAEDRTYLTVRALEAGAGMLEVVTMDGEQDSLPLEALDPVHYEIRLGTPPMLASLLAWDDPELDEVPFAFTPGTQMDVTLEAQGPGGQRLAGAGLANWAPLDPALAEAEPIARTDALHVRVSETIDAAELIAFESSDEVTRLVPVVLTGDVESVAWEAGIEASLPDQVQLDLGDRLDVFVTARDGMDQVIVPSPSRRLELAAADPDLFAVDHHDLRDWITISPVEPGTFEVTLTYLEEVRPLTLVVNP